MKKFLAALLAIIGMSLTFGGNISSAQGKILVAYFSRVGNEYGVGNIKKGNTAIVAEIIAQKTGADLFEIKTVKSYPDGYDECTKIASREKAEKARPSLSANVENFEQYEKIFIGGPIWYGDYPMAVYTFLETYNLNGKTVIPFVTHGGSGLSSVDQRIALIYPNAKQLQGFEIRGVTAQKDRAQTESKVTEWLKKINMIN